MAVELADDEELLGDWYKAVCLLAGEDLSAKSLFELLDLSVELLGPEGVADIWRVAYDLKLLEEKHVQQWILYEGIVDGLGTVS
jgi:hypothetical protein